MSNSGKKSKSGPPVGVTRHPHHKLGSESNPLIGPAEITFDGPRHNFSPAVEHIASGRASPLGTQANPIIGPAIGSSPGVQNPGEATIAGPRSSAATVTQLDPNTIPGTHDAGDDGVIGAGHTPNTEGAAATSQVIHLPDEDGVLVEHTVEAEAGQSIDDAVAAHRVRHLKAISEKRDSANREATRLQAEAKARERADAAAAKEKAAQQEKVASSPEGKEAAAADKARADAKQGAADTALKEQKTN